MGILPPALDPYFKIELVYPENYGRYFLQNGSARKREAQAEIIMQNRHPLGAIVFSSLPKAEKVPFLLTNFMITSR